MSARWYDPFFFAQPAKRIKRLEVCHGKKNPAHGRVFGLLVAGAEFGTLPVVFDLAA